jgi:branched-chain amino acid transport system permease protein
MMRDTGVALYRVRKNIAFLVVLSAYGICSAILYLAGVIHSDVLVTSAIFFILVMGMDLLFGCAGLLSFGHVGFFAIGAYTVAILFNLFAVTPSIGILAAVILNAGLSYVLGRVCLRLSGSYFMLGTLAFGIMIHAVITVWYPVTGGDAGLGGIPRPSIYGFTFQSDLAFGCLAWACAIALFWLTLNLSNSRIGRALRATRSDAIGSACVGINVGRLKTSVFVVSSLYASLSGSLFAIYNGAVHPDSFSLSALLDVLLMLFFGGEGTIWGALLGTTLIRALPDISGPLQSAKILFNGILFSLVIYAFPRGLAGAIEDAVARWWQKPAPEMKEARTELQLPMCNGGSGGSASLIVQGIERSFGGVRAVDGIDLEVESGELRGLIGPNGAGKSTLINLITGVVPPDSGRVLLGKNDLTGLRPDQIAQSGVQRTFQQERLFNKLTVVENVMVGCEGGTDGALREFPACALSSRSSLEAEAAARRMANTWLESLGLGQYADMHVEGLPHGLRKLVEVARACATGPAVLLLDETAAGLNDAEKLEFKRVIAALRKSNLTIVLIEHDIDFVMELSDRVTVVNFGKKIGEGTPDQVRNNEAVILAYLGT